MGVDDMNLGGVAQFGNHLNLKHIKLRGSTVDDSVVIRGDSNDCGNFVFEASDLHSSFKIRSGEGPENGTWRVVHVALTKGFTADAQAIENSFKQKDPRCEDALVDYRMYCAAKKLLKLFENYFITREDFRALVKVANDKNKPTWRKLHNKGRTYSDFHLPGKVAWLDKHFYVFRLFDQDIK